jgi:putative tricarboxylic transport membrane protein
MFFQEKSEMKLADLVGGLVVLLLGITIVFFSSQLPYYSEYGPGPGFLPLWLGIVLIGSAVFVLVNILRKQVKADTFLKPRTKKSAMMFILIFISFLLLPLLGFAVGLAFFSGLTMRVMGKHSWMACGLTAVGIAIGIHFVFGQWLNIPLPAGVVGW